MKQLAKNTSGLWLSATAVVVLLILAAWQFYVFVTFRSDGSIDLQGGRLHLWIALAATVLAGVTGFFVLSVLMRYDEKSELHIT